MAGPPVKIARTVKDLRRWVGRWRADGDRVALVPTMGALHAGHLALVKLVKRKADKAVVSIFVNPTQFAPHEDLSRYPRDEAGDVAKQFNMSLRIEFVRTSTFVSTLASGLFAITTTRSASCGHVTFGSGWPLPTA